MVDKQVTLKVATDVELSKVQALEDNIRQLKQQKLQLDIDADTAKLQETEHRIQSLKTFLDTVNSGNTNIKIDDSQIQRAENELSQLESEKIDLELSIETSSLRKAESEVEALDNETIDLDLNMSMQNITQGIQQAKQGLMDLKNNIDEVAQAGIQSQQNLAFLELNMGAEKAKNTMSEISQIVAKMPGDDNTMRSVLSTAQALGNNLNTSQMEAATKTMADYMAGSATMGKQAVESQQDIMKYLLDGNTAELERGSIVSAHVDKLKQANTFVERQAAMQQVLNDLGYGGISTVDTMINKQAEWDGMIYNSQDALSSMWLGAQQGAMDYILKLNDGTNGLLGMGIVAGQMVAGPLVDVTTGLGQIATGMKAIKDLGMIQYLKDLELVTKLSSAAQWLENTALWGMIAPILANPITWLVIALIALAAALVWAYYNVDWFREMVDNAWASIQQFAGYIWGALTGAIQWLGDLFNQFTNQLGLNTNDWVQSLLGFILFLPQLPLKVGVALVNTIAKLLGFKGNFVQSMIGAASNAINGFISYITRLPGIVLGEFNRVLGLVNDFINHLPEKVWEMGSAIIDALKKSLGIGSPGHMYYMLEGELERLENLPEDMKTGITGNISNLGAGIVDSFNPELETYGVNGGVNGSVSGAGNVVNITINGDVDNEKRVQEIVDAVTRALAWDNKTAGRNI